MAAINHPSQQQQYCLQWKSFHTNMSDVFQNMLVHENLVDVTLACEGASIKAHKMILAACSPYFQNLFMTNPCKHPIVILKDVKFNDLKSIIDFIYSGEVNIPQDQLTSLLKTAETLKIKGLDNFGERQLPNHLGKNSIPHNYPSFNLGKKRKRPRSSQFTHVNNNNPSAINNSPHKTTFNKINSNNVQPNNNNNTKEVLTTTTTNGDNGDSSDDECNNSSKSASIDKSYYSSNVPSPNFNKNTNNNNNNNSTTQNNLFENENEREDSEEFEPTKLLEQSMSTPENTGVDYSPENNPGDEPSGDEDENEDNKEFIREDDYSSNNSNTDNLVLPVGINFTNRFITTQTNNNDSSINNNNNNNNVNGNGNANTRSIEEYETLLSEIQQKNLTTCPICSKEFIKKSKLIRHYHTHFSDFRPKFSCVFCGKLFTTQDWCKRHALNCQLKHYQHVSQMSPYLND